MSKREEMLGSTLRLFASEGYENVGIQKIVDSVEVKKPTLYHYFGSKQGLLEALLKEFYVPFLQNIKKTAEYNGDIVKNLEELTNLYFDAAKKSKDRYMFMLSLVYSSAESEARITAEPHIKEEFNILEEMFKNAEKSHGNMKDRSNIFAVTFQGMITSHVISYFNGQIDLTEHSSYEACRQFMYGIFS